MRKRPCPAAAAAVFCLAALLILCLAPAAPADNDVLTRAEWASFLHDPRLRAADEKLNATYRTIMSRLSRQEKNTLIRRQRAWVTERNRAALAGHPKGSPEYIWVLADMTLERETELTALYPAPETEKTRPAPMPTPPRRAAEPEKPADKTPAPAPQTPPATTGTPPPSRPETTDPVPAERPAATEPGVMIENRVPVPAAPTPDSTRPSKAINVTPAAFARTYNRFAADLGTLFFPKAPTGGAESGHSKTEQYRISDAVTVQFKYSNGHFKEPEIITFVARRFMTGPENGRTEILFSLAGLIKTLSRVSLGNAGKDAAGDAAKDRDISVFVRDIAGGFDADASRIWKQAGLVYVVTYLKQNDILAMVVTRDVSAR